MYDVNRRTPRRWPARSGARRTTRDLAERGRAGRLALEKSFDRHIAIDALPSRSRTRSVVGFAPMSDKPAAPSSPRQPGTEAGSGVPIGDLRAYVAIVRRRKWSLILVVANHDRSGSCVLVSPDPDVPLDGAVHVKPLNPDQLQGSYTYNFGVSMTDRAGARRRRRRSQSAGGASGHRRPESTVRDTRLRLHRSAARTRRSLISPMRPRSPAGRRLGARVRAGLHGIPREPSGGRVRRGQEGRSTIRSPEAGRSAPRTGPVGGASKAEIKAINQSIAQSKR